MKIFQVSNISHFNNGGCFDYRNRSLLSTEFIEYKEESKIPLETWQAYSLNFDGYGCELKSLYKRGLIEIKYSFYGGKLRPKSFSVEHVIPKSKGGKNCQENYVICNRDQNSNRGNSPLDHYINWEAVGIYLKQFEGIKVKGFNGDNYIKSVIAAINEALQKGY